MWFLFLLRLAQTTSRDMISLQQQPTAFVSILADPGMQASIPSTAWTGWNFCNGASAPAAFPSRPSPRMADCGSRVSVAMNDLGPGDALPGFDYNGTDEFARAKERYLGQACALSSARGNYSASFSIMFKVTDTHVHAHICPPILLWGRSVSYCYALAFHI